MFDVPTTCERNFKTTLNDFEITFKTSHQKNFDQRRLNIIILLY